MHFPIIKLESLETSKADFSEDLGYEDPTLNRYTDYYGEVYNNEDRKAVIKSKWLKELFEGIATINVSKGTIRFLDKDTIRRTFSEYLLDLTNKLYISAEAGELTGYGLRLSAVEYKDSPVMFFMEYGYTSFEFMEDAVWHAGETWKIGNIFDAHF